MLGSSHAMWNITQNIFASHFGDSSNCNNLGAWHFLNTMGVYTDSAEVAKKDFLSMINVIESIHEATICYCLWQAFEFFFDCHDFFF
jgi:hypothetical protein